ncbi:CehA/McbA family metallohydrolase [Spirillospora sp. NPDC048911]|uniref:CehA/McbA family metallohydrolase n=1 Tax=Spirillospora sp. NPDC048911 TaxID=3364527 RepID=UPI0037133F1F
MCDDPTLPPEVKRALQEYRDLLAEHGPTWGEDPIMYVRQMDVDAFMVDESLFWLTCVQRAAELHPGASDDELAARIAGLDFQRIIRDTLGGRVLDNLAALRVTPEGTRLDARAQAVLDGRPIRTHLLVDSSRTEPVTVRVDDHAYEIEPGGAQVVAVTSASAVSVDGAAVALGALTRPAVPARLRLRAGFPCRWTVAGENGQGWYPEGAEPNRDAGRMPYFHGDDLVVDVPAAEPLTVRVTRGMEYEIVERTVTPGGGAGEETLVELVPRRLYDAAGRGWYGGDLHVHLNWAGDAVGTPAQAAALQHGEDLHVLNLVAGNVASERVYDREALEHWAGRDLPWSDATHIARMGVEYRNDLLGHLYAFGVPEPPGRYHTGFLGTVDWPPNAAACRELRERGAIMGYSHPFHVPFGEDDPPPAALTAGRNCSARESVADAALGLIDSLDVLNHSSIEATAVVYRHLIGAGNTLAVTAGTDTMFSFNRRGSQSSPPGWERVYARVDGPLTAESFAEAVRRGRTFATTGPFVELDVAGHGPGHTLDLAPGTRVTITVRTIGPEVTGVQVRTAEGVLAEGPPDELTAELVVAEPTYVVAVVTGPSNPRSYHYSGSYAHTSPVYLDVGGAHVARRSDVRWCLDYLDALEERIRTHGRLDTEEQLSGHIELIDAARAVYRARLDR